MMHDDLVVSVRELQHDTNPKHRVDRVVVSLVSNPLVAFHHCSEWLRQGLFGPKHEWKYWLFLSRHAYQ